jgi:hypothetical protein
LAFVAMVIWLGLVLFSEVQFMQLSRVANPAVPVMVVVLQGATLAYSIVRSRKDKPLDVPMKGGES